MNAVLEQVNSMGKAFVEFAVPMLVQSSVLILILLLVDLALRKKVKAVFRYCIWMLVLVKLILPTSLSSPLSLGYWFGDHLAYVAESKTAAAPEAEAEEPALAYMLHIIEPPPIEESRPAPAVLPMIPGAEPAATEVVRPPAVPVTPITWQGVVFLLWLAVVIALGLLLLQRAMFVCGLVAQAKEANSLMNGALEYCCKCMGVKRKVGLKVSANATSPAVCGLFRPVILLPHKLAPSLGSRGLRAVLLHELAHIRRKDLWVNLVQTVLQIGYFYNPLLWLANAMIRRVREQAIDETVLVAMGEKAQQYPQTLVNVAKLAFKRPALSLRLIGVVESKSALAGRIKHILNRPMPKSAKVGIVGVLAVIIAGAILLPMAACTPGPPSLVIKGIVKDVQTGKPIAGARVFDDGYGPMPVWKQIKADMRSEWGAITNSAGEYSFLTWPEHHSIKVEAPGYKAKRQSLYDGHFVFNKKDEQVMDFALEPERVSGSSGFKTTLPNGVTVELVGVCEHPSEGKQWWRPDGSSIEADGFRDYDFDDAIVPEDNQFLRLLALRFDDDVLQNMRFSWVLKDARESRFEPDYTDKERKKLRPIQVIEAAFPKAVQSTNLQLGVATGPWKSVAAGAPATRGAHTLDSITQGDVIYSEAREDNGYIHISATHLLGGDYDCRIVAKGKDGKVYEPSKYSNSGREMRLCKSEFDISLEQVKWFYLQARPFQWLTFKNVSLKPNFKTDVQVEGEGASEKNALAWGEEVDGLQLGLSYDSQERPYYQGEIVSFEVHARNNGDKAVDLSYVELFHWCPHVRDVRDANDTIFIVNVDFIRGDALAREEHTFLRPGDSRALGKVMLRIGPVPKGAKRTKYTADLEPGRYIVTQTGRFGDPVRDNWRGELTTSELPLTILLAKEPSRPGLKTDVQVEGARVKKTASQQLSFGPVVKRVLGLDRAWIDLDRGITPTPPSKESSNEAQLQWCRESGVDAVGRMATGRLDFLDAEMVKLDDQAWTGLSVNGLRRVLKGDNLIRPSNIDGFPTVALNGKSEKGRTYGFRTREGTLGLLKIDDLWSLEDGPRKDNPNLPAFITILYKLALSPAMSQTVILERPLSIGEQQYLDLDSGEYVFMPGENVNPEHLKNRGVDIYLILEKPTPSAPPTPMLNVLGMATGRAPHKLYLQQVPANSDSLSIAIAHLNKPQRLRDYGAHSIHFFRTAQGKAGAMKIKWLSDEPPKRVLQYKFLPELDIPIEKLPWALAVNGVQSRLRAQQYTWSAGEMPTLSLDFRNHSEKTISFVRIAQAHCEVEIDGAWYGWAEPLIISAPVWQLGPGTELDDAISIKLTDSWALPRRANKLKHLPGVSEFWGKRLELTPGKHTVRVRFRPDDWLESYIKNESSLSVVSNPVEIGILPAEQPDVQVEGEARVSKLLAALEDENEFVRADSAKAIGNTDPTNPQAVPALIEAMTDESGRVRSAAAQSLAKVGPVNKEVILAFINAADDNWKGVRYACDTFFTYLGPQHSYVIPDLIEMLKTPNERAQRLAITALGNMGEATVPAVPYLAKNIKNPRLESVASGALRKLGPRAGAAVPGLIEMLEDKRKRFSAALVLEAIGPAAEQAIPALQNCLGQGPQVTFARALLAIDPKSAKAADELVRIAESPYVPNQWTEQPDAHYLLVKYGHNRDTHLQGLIDALENPNPRIRLSAAAYLGRLGAEANKAVDSLQRALKDDDPEVRVEAAQAILVLAPSRLLCKQAVDMILSSLDSKETMVQLRAAGALQAFGPEQKWAVPALIAKIHARQPRTRSAVIQTLGNIGPPAKEALPYLKELLRNEGWQIRRSAAEAIAQIKAGDVQKTDVRESTARRAIAERRKPAGRIEFLGLDLTDAPYTTKYTELPDLFEARPPGSKSYHIRKDVTVVYSGLYGTVYYIPKKNIFYVQHDLLGASTLHYYGPFKGDPRQVLRLETDVQVEVGKSAVVKPGDKAFLDSTRYVSRVGVRRSRGAELVRTVREDEEVFEERKGFLVKDYGDGVLHCIDFDEDKVIRVPDELDVTDKEAIREWTNKNNVDALIKQAGWLAAITAAIPIRDGEWSKLSDRTLELLRKRPLGSNDELGSGSGKYSYGAFKTSQGRIGVVGLARLPGEGLDYRSLSIKYKLLKTDVSVEVENASLRAGVKTDVDLTLYQGREGSISGKVVGRRIFYKKPERLTRNIVPENFERRQDTPLSGVKIVLKSNTGLLKETITDETGRYRFEGLRADDYMVRAELPQGAAFDRDNYPSLSRHVKLESEPRTDVDLHFRLDGISIAGRVTDTNGNPIGGAKVIAEFYLQGEDEGMPVIKKFGSPVMTLSAADGRYRLDGLCPVTFSETATYLIHGKLYRWYEMRVQAKGYSPARVLVPPVTEHLVGETSRLMEDYKGLYGERDSSSAEVALPESQGNSITGIDFVLETDVPVESKTDILDQLGDAPEEVRAIGKVLKEWFESCAAGDLERVKDTFVPNNRSKAEEELKEMRQFLAMAPGWQFSPMVIRMGDSRAEAISHDFVISAEVPEYSGDPIVIIMQLMKVDGQWGILGWSGDSLRSISHAHFQRKYPQSRIWFDKSIPEWLKPDQQTDVDVDIEELKGISEKVKPGYSFADKVRAITGDKEIFESYFTDSIEGGKALEKWWPKRNEDPDVDKKIFGMVRNGLRRDSRGKERKYRNQYIKWVGNKYIWSTKSQNQEVVELMYYATFDSQLASDAVYYGLSVVRGKKSDKILKRLVELCMANVNVSRILWGTKGQHEGMVEYLEPYLTSGDLQIKNRASVLGKVFKGEINYSQWVKEQRRQKRQAEFGEKLPEIREVLLRGSSHQRRELFDLIKRNDIHILFDESFVEPLKACLKDGAPSVREAAIEYGGDLFGKRGECSDETLEVMNNLSKDWDHKVRKATAVFIGGHWIWGVEPQNPKAIEIMMELSKDRDLGVRNQAVYYGLSVVENKSDKVIKRLIEMALDAGASSDLGRIGWGLGRGADKEKIKMYLMPYLEPGNRKGERASQLYREMFKAEPPNSPKEATKDKGLVVKTSALQSLIDSARAGDTVIVPEGVYTEPIEITKSLTLKGQSRAACVFEVTADKPAIFIDTKGKGRVTIEAVTIKWQLATDDKSEYYFAVGVKDSKAEVKNCNFVPLGNFKRSPVAINAIGFSNLTINTCRFEGFEYTVCYGEGTEGTIQDSLVMGSGHQGISLYSGATVKIIRNVVTGSKYHGVRSTGGTLDMKDNLIIENANRGVYLGNKSAHGTITNNIITGNRLVGISGFAQSDVKIYNNLILNSGQVGIGAQPSCRFLLKDNIIKGNPSGIVVFLKEGARRGNLLIRRNTFWNNETDTENCEKAPQSISEEPAFRDPANGDFSLTGGKVMEQKQGLTDPKVFKALWKRWENRADKTDVSVDVEVMAALGWLKLIDDEDYAKSFDEMAALYRGAVSKADWEKTMDLHKKGFGKVVSRKVESKRRTRYLPTGPAGEYVIIEFKSSFEYKSKAAETVTLMRDRDGVWRVTRYFIE